MYQVCERENPFVNYFINSSNNNLLSELINIFFV